MLGTWLDLRKSDGQIFPGQTDLRKLHWHEGSALRKKPALQGQKTKHAFLSSEKDLGCIGILEGSVQLKRALSKVRKRNMLFFRAIRVHSGPVGRIPSILKASKTPSEGVFATAGHTQDAIAFFQKKAFD